MKREIKKHDVVQFTENHKWVGCLGIVNEVKTYSDGKHRYMVGVPIPDNQKKGKVAYIFDDGSNIESVGPAVLSFGGDDDD